MIGTPIRVTFRGSSRSATAVTPTEDSILPDTLMPLQDALLLLVDILLLLAGTLLLLGGMLLPLAGTLLLPIDFLADRELALRRELAHPLMIQQFLKTPRTYRELFCYFLVTSVIHTSSL